MKAYVKGPSGQPERETRSASGVDHVRVAVLQDQIGIGGRNKVIAETIRVFNNQGIRPEILCLSNDRKARQFRDTYGHPLNLAYELHRVCTPLEGRGMTVQAIALNVLCSRRLRSYDLVVTSHGCLAFLPDGPTYIHYVHHPLEAELLYNKRYRSSFGWKLYMRALLVVLRTFSKVKSGHFFIANSVFTKQRMVNTWGLASNQVRVIYPPTVEEGDISMRSPREPVSRVLSLGSFTPDKRQAMQLILAQAIPGLQFRIAGKVSSAGYFARCRSIVANRGLKNVTLLPNLSADEVVVELTEADLFLHTREDEHFGISTVEAIARGCVPVVHDSGGQREVVPFDELRFSTDSTAIERLGRVSHLSGERRGEMIRALQRHISMFTATRFRRLLVGVVGEALESKRSGLSTG